MLITVMVLNKFPRRQLGHYMYSSVTCHSDGEKHVYRRTL